MTLEKEKLNINPSVKVKLARLGLINFQDIAFHIPARYDDETKIIPIKKVEIGRVQQVEGLIVDVKVLYRPKRNLSVYIEDPSGVLHIRFFNFYPSQAKTLIVGARVRAVGEVRSLKTGLEMAHPRYKIIREHLPLPISLTPIYPTCAGLKQLTIRRLVKIALSHISKTDTLTDSIRDMYSLMPFAQALSVLHNPPPTDDTQAIISRQHPAWRRLKFDELLAQQLCLRIQRRKRNNFKAISHYSCIHFNLFCISYRSFVCL